MTNEQAKALAEKVWGRFGICGFSSFVRPGFYEGSGVYQVGCGDKNNSDVFSKAHGSGGSWEEAFFAAGIKLQIIKTKDCHRHPMCEGCKGILLGDECYTLVKGS